MICNRGRATRPRLVKPNGVKIESVSALPDETRHPQIGHRRKTRSHVRCGAFDERALVDRETAGRHSDEATTFEESPNGRSGRNKQKGEHQEPSRALSQSRHQHRKRTDEDGENTKKAKKRLLNGKSTDEKSNKAKTMAE
ncbi:hypothetical protein TRVL_01292 [Trypanosoma vivax]|nr:hypothetical protein TRVL_01292 [Trypanosoma vivax]